MSSSAVGGFGSDCRAALHDQRTEALSRVSLRQPCICFVGPHQTFVCSSLTNTTFLSCHFITRHTLFTFEDV